jgi:2-dehydropantoate 2-reductase
VSEIAVLGPGGVGGFLAAALDRAGEPTLVVARETTAETIARDGITVESVRLGGFTAHPPSVPALRQPVDVLFVATKATTLPAALERVETEPRLVVPLLNGLEHMTRLRERFAPERVAAGAIRIEASTPSPGQIRQTSPFLRVDLAADDPALHPPLAQLAEILERADVPARVETNEAQILWSKLVRLCALACTTSASDETIGFIRSDPEWRQTLIAAIDEAAAVANADGAQIDPAVPLGELEDAHPGLGSSMQRDIAAGREPELDAIAGAVLRAGRRHGLACPTIERLRDAISERVSAARAEGQQHQAGGALR